MRYSLYGLTLDSERSFPHLMQAEPSAQADVRLVFTPLEPIEVAPLSEERFCRCYPNGIIRYHTGYGGVFEVAGPDLIRAHIPPDVPDAMVCASLLGTPMGVLLHYRGMPPLHASALAVGDRAVAIAGHRGAGKSTLARALLARGHRLLSDDQVVLDPLTGRVLPGYPGLTLWADASVRAGDGTPDGLRISPQFEKYHLPFPGLHSDRPSPLALIVAMAANPDLTAHQVIPLTVPQAHVMLHIHTYWNKGWDLIPGAAETALLRAGTLARRVPVVALERSTDPDRLADLCADIEQRVAAAGSGPEDDR